MTFVRSWTLHIDFILCYFDLLNSRPFSWLISGQVICGTKRWGHEWWCQHVRRHWTDWRLPNETRNNVWHFKARSGPKTWATWTDWANKDSVKVKNTQNFIFSCFNRALIYVDGDRKRTCYFNAGMSHSCDYKELLQSADDANHWSSEHTPGKRRKRSSRRGRAPAVRSADEQQRPAATLWKERESERDNNPTTFHLYITSQQIHRKTIHLTPHGHI